MEIVDTHKQNIRDAIVEWMQLEGIEDNKELRSLGGNIWHSCIMYIGDKLYKYDNRISKLNNKNSRLDLSDIYILDNILDAYIYYCGLYNKEITVLDFATLICVHPRTINRWIEAIYRSEVTDNIYNIDGGNDYIYNNNMNGGNGNNNSNNNIGQRLMGGMEADGLSSAHSLLGQKLLSNAEQSTYNVASSRSGNQTIFLAKLNKYFLWSLPGVTKEVKSISLTADKLPILGKATDEE